MDKIRPCLWFDNQAEEAAKFYCSVFPNSKMGTIARYGEHSSKASGRPKDSVMTVLFEIDGLEIMGLNGGPHFKINPSISLFVTLDSADKVVELHKKLMDGGSELMPLDKYFFAEKYAWVQDKYGVSWQLFSHNEAKPPRPCLMFCGPRVGKCEEALRLYTSIFDDSEIEFMHRYEEGEHKGQIMHSAFKLNGQGFVAMDGAGPHAFSFDEGVSLAACCNTQAEIDKLWRALGEGGEIQQCGWLKDKFGVAWQIAPSLMDEIMKDPKRGEKAMEAVLTMKKLEIKELELAASK
ncbi:MAG: VOC family protein [Candidatus Melainabacteria bacterium]|nr:VOC family protein [Candidatus Melainabacteria bacterium]